MRRVHELLLLVLLLFCSSVAQAGTVTDIDCNVYQTVTIGSQVWMAENLKVTHYRNGDTIPNVTDGPTWAGLTSGAYCEYNNDVNKVATYGRLYNGYAVADSRNIAPSGWHVASDAEWKQLEMTLGMSQAEADVFGWRGTTEGDKLKEIGTTHWYSPNTDATNESGFTALPGGVRTIDGTYGGVGGYTYFWSSTELVSNQAWYRHLYYDRSAIYRHGDNERYGFSVRCVKDPDTIIDIDGNVYPTVTIGTQTWMAENLKVTHYRNGEAIPDVTNGTAWAGLTTGAYCEYNNDVNKVATYGRLYNGYAVADSRNIAPSGWHVASDAEWKQLEMTLGMSQAQADTIGARGTTEGGKLKEIGTTHWASPNTGATNVSGFSALPGGYRLYLNGTYYGTGAYAIFWSSAEVDGYYAWGRYLNWGYSGIARDTGNKESGFSVRCVKNTTVVTQLSINSESVNHVVGHSPSFTWSYVADSGLQDTITFEVGTNSDWSVAEMWSTGEAASTDTFVNYGGTPLSDGGMYFVRLRVHAPSGWSDWCYTSFHMNSPPAVPYPYAPTWPLQVGTTPDLSLANSTDAESDTIYYDFQVFRDSMLTQLAVEGDHIPETHNPDSTTWTVTPPLDDNHYYYWRARAFDGYEYSAWSWFRLFIVNAFNDPPNAPILLGPPDSTGSILYNRRPTLLWTLSTDPDPYEQVHYRLQLATDSAFLFRLQIDTVWTSYWMPPDSLPHGAHYWWRVWAIDRQGAEVICPSMKSFWTYQLGDFDASHNCDIADLSRLIDYLYISFTPITPLKVADLDGDCHVDISDLSRLIDRLYISFAPLGVGCEL